MDTLDCLQWFFTWFRSLYTDGAGLIERIFKVWLMEVFFFIIILAGLPWSREVESLEILYGLESIRILGATQSWKNLHKLHWRSSCCTCLQDLNLWYDSSWVFEFFFFLFPSSTNNSLFFNRENGHPSLEKFLNSGIIKPWNFSFGLYLLVLDQFFISLYKI